MKEYKDVMASDYDNMHFEVNLDNLRDEWRIKFEGPADTPYEGGIFIVKVKHPESYPFQPPKF